jgi:hypothetical protein
MRKKGLLISVIGLFMLFQPLSAQTWEAQKRLTWTSDESAIPAIASDSMDNIHMVWTDETPGNSEIFYKKSTNGGSSWSTKRLTWNSGVSSGPEISTDSSDNIHVIWWDDTPGNSEIFYKKSTNYGSSWTSKRLTWTSGSSAFPAIATDTSDNIHIVWFDDTPGNREIFYKMSTNGGSDWTTKRLTWNSSFSSSPAIATDSSDNIHIVWWDLATGDYQVFYKKSTDGGSSWSTKRLTWSSGNSLTQVIAVDSSNNIHVTYQDDTPGNFEIYYKKSTNGGSSWTTKRLTWNLGNSYPSAISADSSDYIHIVCYDGTPGNFEVYHLRSTNGGTNWANKRLTWNSGDSTQPVIAFDSSDNIHVVWDDLTPGNKEIFYRKGIQ